MVVRTARASWAPDSHGGGGNIRAESGALSAEYSLNSRFGADPGTNPEELLGAAHAACFNLALAGALTKAGHPPARLETAAEVAVWPKLSVATAVTEYVPVATPVHANVQVPLPASNVAV